ncbi:hypothetical protein [Thermofilum pendens]|uniref:Uncharacterized protein n=1 Tax=Thermofilum pendens (strain DSM 2475 / Hrk 5) TaxID=368408 RepID=A1RXN4_THEPD|nr:hypothetical protein [Thermofilum pendens]ABL77964.1 hypothetical protein Tpen_0558 [Thermofilum pendens Hrk 5]
MVERGALCGRATATFKARGVARLEASSDAEFLGKLIAAFVWAFVERFRVDEVKVFYPEDEVALATVRALEKLRE